MKLACLQIEARRWKDSGEAWAEIKKMILETAKDHDLLIVPECVYPAYFLAPVEKPEVEVDIAEILEEIKEICRTTHTYVAFGYASGNENRASLFNPQGEEIARKVKSNLWHFDKKWFKPGEEVVTADTEFGKVGLVICADARLPELVRMVALAGAKLIIDLANLTATGPEMAKLSNAQCDYMLSTRARENKVWLAVSDKWGVEADVVTYAGRAAVYSPDGTCVAQAPSDKNMILSVEIPTDAKGEIICISGEELPPRRPELYSSLTVETAKLPVYSRISEAVVPERLTAYVTVSSLESNAPFQDVNRHIQLLLGLDPELIVLPAQTGEQDFTRFQGLLSNDQFLVVSHSAGKQTQTYLLNNKEILATYRTVSSVPQNGSENPENNFPVVKDLPFGSIGFLHEKEMLLPEAARCLMLNGADAIIWQHGMPFDKAAPLARTRAAENRIFVVAVYSKALGDASNGASFIVDPSGMIIASTLLNRTPHATGAYCNFCNSRLKSIVPGTHVVLDRKPSHYQKLVQK